MPELGQTPPLIQTLTTIAPYFTGGLAGAFLTYILKTWDEKRKRRIISLNITDLSLSLPNVGSVGVLPFRHLKVSFEGQEFDHLRLYTVLVYNTGFRGVEGLKLAFSFPEDITVIRSVISSEPLSIPCTVDTTVQNESKETVYSLGRLEKGDRIRLAFLVDTRTTLEIKCLPRGVDDVEFITSKDEFRSADELYRTVILTPAFKMIFLATLFFTTLSLVISILITIVNPSPSPELAQLLQTATTTWKIGFGATVGLMGAKSLS